MNENPSTLRRWLVSLALSGALFVAGWKLMPTEGSWGAIVPILGGMACFLIGACILAMPLAQWFAEPWGTFYFSPKLPSGKAPMYGIPQARRKSGKLKEAMAEYEAIVNEYPTELKAYVEMIDLAIVDMKDLPLAERICERGLLAIQNEDDRHALEAMYRAISSRLYRREGPPRKVGIGGWRRS